MLQAEDGIRDVAVTGVQTCALPILITYTGKGTNTLTGITRGAFGTATTGTSNGQAHSNGATVTDATEWGGWGDAVDADRKSVV